MQDLGPCLISGQRRTRDQSDSPPKLSTTPRYRPRYPGEVFDDLVESAGLSPGDPVVEIGAGSGIATEALGRTAEGRGTCRGLVEPGGSLALVWTEVISSGQEPIESLPYPLYQLASDLQAWPGRSEPIGTGVEPCRSSRTLSERSWGRPLPRTKSAVTNCDDTQRSGPAGGLTGYDGE